MPNIRTFKHVASADPVLRQVQDSLRETFRPITSGLVTNGVVIGNVVLAVGNNQISHGLGRAYTSYYLGRQRPMLAFAHITEIVSTNINTSVFLVLNSTAACAIDILVT
jgi:hypothetical protein